MLVIVDGPIRECANINYTNNINDTSNVHAEICSQLAGSNGTKCTYKAWGSNAPIYSLIRFNKSITTLFTLFMEFKYSVFSNSWGSVDDTSMWGVTLSTTELQILYNVSRVHNNIIVWAAGNGGRRESCETDELSSSFNVITVASAVSHNRVYYDEYCSSVVGAFDTPEGTILVDGNCVPIMPGTSIATAQLAGLLYNKRMLGFATQRQIYHALIATMDTPPQPAAHWSKNGAGLSIHPFIGFGIINSTAFLAHTILPLATERVCEYDTTSYTLGNVAVDNCTLLSIEWVQLTVEIQTQTMNKYDLYLRSEANTYILILSKQTLLTSILGTKKLYTNRFWGEAFTNITEWRLISTIGPFGTDIKLLHVLFRGT